MPLWKKIIPVLPVSFRLGVSCFTHSTVSRLPVQYWEGECHDTVVDNDISDVDSKQFFSDPDPIFLFEFLLKGIVSWKFKILFSTYHSKAWQVLHLWFVFFFKAIFDFMLNFRIFYVPRWFLSCPKVVNEFCYVARFVDSVGN
jgi:hypothetical protein